MEAVLKEHSCGKGGVTDGSQRTEL